MSRPADTSAAAWEVQTRILREMGPERRLELVRTLTVGAQELAFAELRARYPDMPDDELWLKLAARRLGPDLTRRVYGREVDPS